MQQLWWQEVQVRDSFVVISKKMSNRFVQLQKKVYYVIPDVIIVDHAQTSETRMRI